MEEAEGQATLPDILSLARLEIYPHNVIQVSCHIGAGVYPGHKDSYCKPLVCTMMGDRVRW